MSSIATELEHRIRERAYHIWEASGRPWGRDQEFWQRACEQIASDNNVSGSAVKSRQPKAAEAARAPRKRSRAG
jgi:hypothetical protein